jgi:AcrR family transcriptional regulator
LRILDDDGLPDLTMRRLAAALDVQPSALYWHFPNKQTLLAELADRIVAPHSRATGAPEGDRLGWHTRTEATALRDALLAYRDGAEVVSSTLAIGLGAGAARSRLSGAILADGFDEHLAGPASAALLHFVIGHASHEQQRLQYDSLGVVPTGAAASEGADATAEFAFGVDLIVLGLAERSARVSQSFPDSGT